jgi:hypothetical protein
MPEKRLYTEDHAARIRERGGGPYRPANGSEGDIFMAMWCDNCSRDAGVREGGYKAGCIILAAALAHNIKDEGYPQEWCHNEHGQPCCTAFEQESDDA